MEKSLSLNDNHCYGCGAPPEGRWKVKLNSDDDAVHNFEVTANFCKDCIKFYRQDKHEVVRINQ